MGFRKWNSATQHGTPMVWRIIAWKHQILCGVFKLWKTHVQPGLSSHYYFHIMRVNSSTQCCRFFSVKSNWLTLHTWLKKGSQHNRRVWGVEHVEIWTVGLLQFVDVIWNCMFFSVFLGRTGPCSLTYVSPHYWVHIRPKIGVKPFCGDFDCGFKALIGQSRMFASNPLFFHLCMSLETIQNPSILWGKNDVRLAFAV